METVNSNESVQRPAIHADNATQRLPGMLEVKVRSADEVDKALEDAVAEITKTATHHRVGILITRTGAGSYIVRAHPAVPYGLIRQHHG